MNNFITKWKAAKSDNKEMMGFAREVAAGFPDDKSDPWNLLWSKLGSDPVEGIEKLSEHLKITHGELTNLVLRRAAYEAARPENGWIRRNWVEISASLMLILLLLLGGRVYHRITVTSGPMLAGRANVRRVIVTARELKVGHILQQDDTVLAALGSDHEYLRDGDPINGLTLARTLPAGRPITMADVLRPQIVATRDISANTLITSDAVNTSSTPFDPDAEVDLEQIIGRMTSVGTNKGSVLKTSAISASPLPFSPDDKVNAELEAAFKQGQVLTIPLAAGSADSAYNVPMKIRLLLTPRDGKPATAQQHEISVTNQTEAKGVTQSKVRIPETISNVWLIAVDRRKDSVTGTIVLKPDDAARLASQMGNLTIYVFK